MCVYITFPPFIPDDSILWSFNYHVSSDWKSWILKLFGNNFQQCFSRWFWDSKVTSKGIYEKVAYLAINIWHFNSIHHLIYSFNETIPRLFLLQGVWWHIIMTWSLSHYKEASFSSLIYKRGLYNQDICITPLCSILIWRGCFSITLASEWLNRPKTKKRQKKELMEIPQSHGPNSLLQITSHNILPCLLRAIGLLAVIYQSKWGYHISCNTILPIPEK